MKQLLLMLAGVLCSIALSAQTYLINGQIKNTSGRTRISVYEFNGVDNWNKVYSNVTGENYAVALEADRDYQVWFSDKHGHTKILAINRGTIGLPEFQMNIDFDRLESAQILRNDSGGYIVTLIDTEFTVLRTPFDLYSE